MRSQVAVKIVLHCMISIALLPIIALGQGEVSEKSLNDLRKEVYQAEEDFYSVYNKLNEDKDYAVRCSYETVTGTRQKNHICRARFVTQAYERHARRNRNDMSRVANQDADPVLAEKTAIYEAKMEALIASNPDLQVAFDRYNQARVEFMAKRDADGNN